ncbi:hypothetical protein [Haladaptatus halobius]|uniref:hypothetical protein n=1 Tax=Haladaptatus halobius TaxID=2884875 RepID=UPI001D0A1685|nr:hypothetical protein [Haladaptatus halobius]
MGCARNERTVDSNLRLSNWSPPLDQWTSDALRHVVCIVVAGLLRASRCRQSAQNAKTDWLHLALRFPLTAPLVALLDALERSIAVSLSVLRTPTELGR